MSATAAASVSSAFHSTFLWRLVSSVVSFNLLLLAFATVALYRDLDASERDAQIDTRNVCQVLDQSLSGTLREVDLSLLSVKNEYERQLLTGGVDPTSIEAFIARQLQYMPDLRGLRIADGSGIMVYGAKSNPSEVVQVADRDYFARLRDDPRNDLVFSSPLFGRVSRQWIVIAARRLAFPDGSFAGVVIGPIPIDRITKRFAALDLGLHSVISLRGEGLELFARYPLAGSPEDSWGSTRAPAEFASFVASGKKESTMLSPTGIDGIPRIVSHSKLDRYPLYLSVGISRKEYLRTWHSDLTKVSLLVLLSVLATTLFGVLLYRTRQREHDAMIQLAKQQEKYRIVADNTQDWEFWLGPDGSCLYCSPSCLEKTGYSAPEFQSEPELFRRVVHPDDRATYDAHRHEAFISNASSNALTFRLVRADGTIRWVEHTCRPVQDGQGRFLGIRGNNRDVTERRRAEQERRYLFDIIERSLNEIYVFDPESFKFRHVNHGALNNLGYTLEEMTLMTPLDIKPEYTEESFRELVRPLLTGQRHVIVLQTVHKRADASTYPVEIYLRLVDTGVEKVFLAILFDITARRVAEKAREEALSRVRTLEGIIPICMYCKKIRDSRNTWSQLERYISEHSEAQFSHGICPSCLIAHQAELE